MYQWLFFYYCKTMKQSDLISEFETDEDLRQEFNTLIMSSKIDINQLHLLENKKIIEDKIRKITTFAVDAKKERMKC